MRKRSLIGRASSALFASTQRHQPKRRTWFLEHLEPRLNMAINLDDPGGGGGGGGGDPPPPPPPEYGSVFPQIIAGASAQSFPPALVRDAYHLDEIVFPNGAVGDGSGQTIAIVVAGSWHRLVADSNQFSDTYGLPRFNEGGPTLQIFNESGGTSLPAQADSVWINEMLMDVQWAHAMAPMANIVVIQAQLINSATGQTTLFSGPAITTAASKAKVVSMSWGTTSTLSSGALAQVENRLSAAGVTFLAAAGNTSVPHYPGKSPNVVGVARTVFDVDEEGHFIREESSLQYGSAGRSFPDVSFVGDTFISGTNFPIIRDGGLNGGEGASIATAMMAGVVAIANQGRAINGLDPQKMTQHFQINSSMVRDVTVGPGAFPGFDGASGVGTAKADKFVAALAGNSAPAPRITDVSAPSEANLGEQFQFVVGANGSVNRVEIWRDSNNNNQLDVGADSLIVASVAEPWFVGWTATGPGSEMVIECTSFDNGATFTLVARILNSTFFVRGQDSFGAWSPVVAKYVFIVGGNMAQSSGSTTAGASLTLGTLSGGSTPATSPQGAVVTSAPSAEAILSYWELTGGSSSGLSLYNYGSMFGDDDLFGLIL